MRRCFRCQGRTKMYMTNGGYSMTDTGGKEVDCPLCAGSGKIDVPKVKTKRTVRRAPKVGNIPVESIQRAVDSVSKAEVSADASRL